jgi:hypothetical protein
MPRMAQFILALPLDLALLAWAAPGMVQTTAREWFERDVSSRAQLVLVDAICGWMPHLRNQDRVGGRSAERSNVSPVV